MNYKLNNNWKLIGVLALLVASVAGAVVYFSLSPKITEKSQKKQMQYQPILKDKAVDIVVGSSGAVPSSVKINNGWMVRFVNNDALDLNMEIKGKTTLVVIGKEKVTYSPPFVQSGVYKFLDKNNSKITGEIVVEGVDPTIASISITPSAQKAAVLPEGKEITISDNGFAEKKITLKKTDYFHFQNSSSKAVNIIPEGTAPVFEAQLLPGKKSGSFIFDQAKAYVYINKNNPSQKIEITVTEK